MMLASYFLTEPIVFREGKINVLIIENQLLFRKTVENFILQEKGENGEFVLSEDYRTLEFAKKAAFLSDIFNIDFSSKKITARINQNICESLSENKDIYEIIRLLNEIGAEGISVADFDIQFSEIESLEDIIPIFDFKIAEEEMELPEKIIEYMKIYRELFKKELFIFVNLKSCFSENEIENFYSYVFYNKFNVLLLESFQRGIPRNDENTVIIDSDLCEIN